MSSPSADVTMEPAADLPLASIIELPASPASTTAPTAPTPTPAPTAPTPTATAATATAAAPTVVPGTGDWATEPTEPTEASTGPARAERRSQRVRRAATAPYAPPSVEDKSEFVAPSERRRPYNSGRGKQRARGTPVPATGGRSTALVGASSSSASAGAYASSTSAGANSSSASAGASALTTVVDRAVLPWDRPAAQIDITPELVGDDLAQLWETTWGDCYACVAAGNPCERVEGKPRCRRCQDNHGQPCDVDMRIPQLGGVQGPLRMRVYSCLLRQWRSGGVGRRRRPNPNVKLSLKTLGEIPEEERELREEVARAGATDREREAARRRARSRPNRPAEAAQERRCTRARAQGEPEEPPTELGDLATAGRRAQALFFCMQEASEEFAHGLEDVAAVLLTEQLRTGDQRHLGRIAAITRLTQSARNELEAVRAWLEGFLGNV